MKIVQITHVKLKDNTGQLIALMDDGRLFSRTTDQYTANKWSDWTQIDTPGDPRLGKRQDRTLAEWNSIGRLIIRGEKSTGRNEQNIATFTYEQTVEAPGRDESDMMQDEW